MNTNNPYLPINEDWLKLNLEEPIDKDLPIIDPHHHLWDLDFGRYLYEDLLSDINISGHNIIASVYIMSSKKLIPRFMIKMQRKNLRAYLKLFLHVNKAKKQKQFILINAK